MKQPFCRDDELLNDIQLAAKDTDSLHLWWLGQSGFLLQWQGQHVLLDPYLSDSLTKKYQDTDKPHVRMTERVIDPSRLDFVDLVTSTHNHTDHLDAETLIPLRGVNPALEIVVPAANRTFAAERLQVPRERLTPLDAGESRAFPMATLHAIPAAHEMVERDDQQRCRFLGYVVQMGPWTIYHSGDTIRYEGMEDWLAPWSIDVALLPINGRAPERRVAGNLWGREAAELAQAISARRVVPCHFDMFEFNTATPDEFIQRCDQLGQSYAVLQNGERLTCSDRPHA